MDIHCVCKYDVVIWVVGWVILDSNLFCDVVFVIGSQIDCNIVWISDRIIYRIVDRKSFVLRHKTEGADS